MGGSLITPVHLIFLLIVLLLLFGAKRLPEIGRSLGTGMREFKDSVTGSNGETKVETRSELPPPVATAPIATPPASVPVAAPEPPTPSATPDSERAAEPVS